MTNLRSQPDFDPGSVAALRETLQQTLPFLEKLVASGRDFLSKILITSTPLPCDSCQKQRHCPSPCDRLNSLLPKIYGGRGHREYLSEFCHDGLSDHKKISHSDIFEKYESCRNIFTLKQWKVICLYYRDGKTEQQIAEELGKSRSTVSGLLIRARKRKEEYDKQLRREKFEYLKKMQKE